LQSPCHISTAISLLHHNPSMYTLAVRTVKSKKRLAKRALAQSLAVQNTAETAISRTCLEAVKSTCLCTSPARSSALAICTFLVRTPTPLSTLRPASTHTTRYSAEGDGEISFCGAIEIAGVITIKFDVIKGGMAKLGMHKDGKSPIFIPGPVEPNFGPGRYIYFEGFSVDENGKQHFLDATVAYRQTTLRCIEYLKRFGYDDYQIYLLLRYVLVSACRWRAILLTRG